MITAAHARFLVVMPGKRPYNLSPAALAQRRANLAHLAAQHIVVPMEIRRYAESLLTAMPPLPMPPSLPQDAFTEAARTLASKRWLNPASEAHREAARINGRNGGRKPKETPCSRCGVVCLSAVAARSHCLRK